ncbi:MAG: ABC transporter ATP-binding protein [Nitrososphaerota archaeon]|nr:ABC transporter ATP-binding protein [Nitrososphaerota archaeon]
MLPVGSTDYLVLKIGDLRVFFSKKRFLEKETVVRAVDGISLDIERGEVVALVGESGSGKTTLGRAAIGLNKPTSGTVTLFENGAARDVGKARGSAWKTLRKRLQIIFQDPFSSIDPNMRVYDTLRIPLQSQGVRNQNEISQKIKDVFKRVGLPEQLLSNYVFQLSGGQRQRLGIARVLLFDPAVIVADEPVSMLDASLKGDILNIIKKESQERGTAFLFITHEMSVARIAAARIVVMYLGNIVEMSSSQEIVGNPLHPYTKALLQASPDIKPELRDVLKEVNVKGELAISTEHPLGCKFHPRCPYVMDRCRTQVPELKEIQLTHRVACWLY